MNREWRKKRMQELIQQQKQNRPRSYSPLFLECVESLQPDVSILSDSDSEEIYSRMQIDFPFTFWGQVDWNVMSNKHTFQSIDEARSYFEKNMDLSNDRVYILWGYGDDPVLQAKLDSIFSSIELVECIGSDQFLYHPQKAIILELYHEGSITMGVSTSKFE
ncbi:CDI toxin immunity protein [Risungbinella massiliensis]|uniref:CDI toxin immunity protein n=1 Tax=Risungbinella massiliensis TaxID=1329796 RepID=UPI0005CC4C76|nr:hypothetical protein [Risungbinella massiliensis]